MGHVAGNISISNCIDIFWVRNRKSLVFVRVSSVSQYITHAIICVYIVEGFSDSIISIVPSPLLEGHPLIFSRCKREETSSTFFQLPTRSLSVSSPSG
uniref:Uncharacterized protein n=1 Tax=Lepeophtheirus salmonis TaxID=72036 RepID=A0A0K2VHZ3_LEPSM